MTMTAMMMTGEHDAQGQDTCNHKTRKDHWRWFLIEAGIRILNVQGYVAAREFLKKRKFKNDVIDRVLKYPAARRQPVTWGTRPK